MTQYETTLTRSFIVTIEANNETDAKRLAELFVGYQDDSTDDDRGHFNFEIKEIKMVLNEAIESEETQADL